MDNQKQEPVNNAEVQSQPPAEQPAPAQNQSMDVVAPPPHQEQAAEAPQQPPAEGAPTSDNPQEQQLPSEAAHLPEHPEAHHPEHHSGAMAAIIATVVIVIALAALATYAYLQTQ